MLKFAFNTTSKSVANHHTTRAEAFRTGVGGRLCGSFELQGFGVCNVFLRTKLTDQLKICDSKSYFFQARAGRLYSGITLSL